MCYSLQHQRPTLLQVRDRAMLHLTQLGGGAGGAAAFSPALDIDLMALEQGLRAYLAAGYTAEPFDLVCYMALCMRRGPCLALLHVLRCPPI